MEVELKEIPSQLFIGKKIRMSLAENQTFQLWSSFMPRRNEVPSINNNFYSIERYPDNYFKNFSADNAFEKWAVMECDTDEIIPEGMQVLHTPGGLYASFNYKGKASEGEKVYRYIFEQWMPNSGYIIDQRPHFAVMGEKYKGDHEDSEEEILIPIEKITEILN